MTAAADRLRVLITAGWYPSDDSPFAGVFIREQAEALARVCDVAVMFVDMTDRWSLPRMRQEGEVRVVRASVPRARARGGRVSGYLNLAMMTVGYGIAVLGAYFALRRQWGRPHIVHGHVLYPGGYAAWLLHVVARIPYVVSEHSSQVLPSVGGDTPWGYGRSILALIRHVARRARRVIAVSKYLAEAVAARGLADNVAVVPNVVHQCPATSTTSVSGLHRVIHVSLMVDEAKNISSLLRAVGLLSARRRDFCLTLVGDGPDRDALQAYARELQVDSGLIEFVGSVTRDDVMRRIAESDFMVVSSRYETFCVAAAEALMCGRPVLSTRCGGPEDFITPEVGLLVPKEDDAALAAGLDWMMDNHSRFNASDVHRYAASRFSADTVAAQLVGIYEVAVTGR